MKAQELRISNYFEYRIQDKIDERQDWWEVSQIDVNDLAILDSNIDYDYRPIQLTEEWLVKFGFEIGKKNYSLNVGMELFDYAVKDKFCIWGGKPGWCIVELPHIGQYYIQYVHQLQNLYFALIGEELTIQP